MIKQFLLRILKSRPVRYVINPSYGKALVEEGDHLCILPGAPNRLGDLIMNNHFLRRLQPHYAISYGVMEWYYQRNEDFLRNHCYARQLLVFPDRWWRMLLFVRKIRKKKIKAAVLLPYFPKGTDLCF